MPRRLSRERTERRRNLCCYVSDNSLSGFLLEMGLSHDTKGFAELRNCGLRNCEIADCGFLKVKLILRRKFRNSHSQSRNFAIRLLGGHVTDVYAQLSRHRNSPRCPRRNNRDRRLLGLADSFKQSRSTKRSRRANSSAAHSHRQLNSNRFRLREQYLGGPAQRGQCTPPHEFSGTNRQSTFFA